MFSNRYAILILLFFSIFIIFPSCTKAERGSSLKSPDEELTEYAQNTGGIWDPAGINTLVYERTGSFNSGELKKLSKEAKQKIRRVLIMSGENKLIGIPDFQFLPSLTYLYLEGNKISDLSPLGGLKLTELYLSENNIRDLSPLEGLKLTKLYLSENSIRDLSPLEGLKLTKILLSENPFSDITPLAEMSTLIHARLDSSLIKELPDLSKWENMKRLEFSNTPLKSLKNLETIPSDFNLYISGCDELEDIDALQYARVNKLFIDEENYERLKPWFDQYVDEIKERRPEFDIVINWVETEL